MTTKNLLYIIIDSGVLIKARKDFFKITKEIIKARPDLIQLRLKEIPTRKAFEQSLLVSKMLKRSKTKLLINDRVDIAKAIGADGVHLGNDDLPVGRARKILGKTAIIGKTAHSLAEVKDAIKEPLDYISIGPVFRTTLKPGLMPLGIKKVKEVLSKAGIKRKKINVFIIGGISLKNIPFLVKEGLTNIAVSRSVTLSKNPGKIIKQFKKQLCN